MANTRGTKPTDRSASDGPDKEPDMDADDGIRTMAAPGGQGAPGAGRPDWGALMQRFGGGQAQPGGIMGGAGQGPQTLPQGGMQRPQWGQGMPGGAMQGPWGQHIQQAIQALSQRFGGMGGQQGGGMFGGMQGRAPWMQQAPQQGNPQPGGITGGPGQGQQMPQWGGAAGGGAGMMGRRPWGNY